MRVFNSVLKYVLASMMFVLVCLTFYQIVMRFVFNSPPSWTEETIRFLFVYVSLVGAGVGIMEHSHIGIDIIVNLLPEKARNVIQILIHLSIMGFGGFLLKASWPLLMMTRRQLSPSLRIPMCYVYGAISIFGILCLIYSLVEIFKLIKTRRAAKEG